MSLLKVLLETIYEKWNYDPVKFNTVYIHPSLAEAIEKSGETLPEEFNLHEFDNEFSEKVTINIVVSEQDILFSIGYCWRLEE